MKKILALCLVILIFAGQLVGCADQQEAPNTTDAQKIDKEDNTMRILVIGASLGFDAMYAMPAVAQNEGVEEFAFGILYRSAGIGYHASYVQSGKPEYAYYEYVSGQDQAWRRADCNGNFTYESPVAANDKYIKDGSIAVSADFGLTRMDWDVVIMLPSSSEICGKMMSNPIENLDMQNADIIMDWAKKKDVEPATVPEFGWHMVWSLPADSSLWNEARRTFMQTYFNSDANAMFEANVKTTKEVVVPALEGKVKYMFPCAAALQNAKTSTVVEDKDIHRDYIHATDFGRLIAAYVWYCELTGTSIRDCKLGPIPNSMVRDNLTRNSGQDYVMTEDQRKVLVEAVENAFAEPYAVTQSAY